MDTLVRSIKAQLNLSTLAEERRCLLGPGGKESKIVRLLTPYKDFAQHILGASLEPPARIG